MSNFQSSKTSMNSDVCAVSCVCPSPSASAPRCTNSGIREKNQNVAHWRRRSAERSNRARC